MTGIVSIHKKISQRRQLEALAQHFMRLEQELMETRNFVLKTCHELANQDRVLDVVLRIVCEKTGEDYVELVKGIRSQLLLFTFREVSSPEEKLIVDGKPKDLYTWDPVPMALGYRYRFIDAENKTLEWMTTKETMVPNPDEHPGIQVFPIMIPPPDSSDEETVDE